MSCSLPWCPLHRVRKVGLLWRCWRGVAAAGVLSLVVSNPSLEDYQAHAGDQLVRLGTKELCDEPTLPMVLRLWIRNCPELIASQRDTGRVGGPVHNPPQPVRGQFVFHPDGKEGAAAWSAPAWF